MFGIKLNIFKVKNAHSDISLSRYTVTYFVGWSQSRLDVNLKLMLKGAFLLEFPHIANLLVNGRHNIMQQTRTSQCTISEGFHH